MSGTNIIVLAAGKGTRMMSSLPKVLHKVLGKTMFDMVCDVAFDVDSSANIVAVVSEEVKNLYSSREGVKFVIQKDKLGTGHAVLCALPLLNKDFKKTVILYGDTPLVSPNIIKNKLTKLNDADLVAGAFEVADITQKYGRLIVQDGIIGRIVEYKNASEEIRELKLCNSGIYAVKTDILLDFVPKIQKNELTQEYYLTDLVEISNQNNKLCKYVLCEESDLLGVNSQQDLADVSKICQQKMRVTTMKKGVIMQAPETVYFWHDTIIGTGTEIGVGVVFGENVEIGKNCKIEPYCVIKNVTFADNVEVKAFSHIDGCIADVEVSIGPFARIRPNSVLAQAAKIGNFVEVKNAKIGPKSKANHLSYVGDAVFGDSTNFGAGSITCNYDGFSKYQTTIGDNVLVGANCSLVAPVIIGNECIIGAGSVVTKDVKNKALYVTRSDGINIENGGEKYRNKRKK